MTSDHTHKNLLKRTQITLNLTFRLAREEDLPKIEWMGVYKKFRRLYRHTFEEQKAGRRLMLVADFNNYPIGHVFLHVRNSQIWDDGRGYLYALRVMEPFQGMKIGTALIRQAEQILKSYGLLYATISVAKENTGARKLYEREGYKIYDEDDGKWSFQDHKGRTIFVDEPSWMLEKKLR